MNQPQPEKAFTSSSRVPVRVSSSTNQPDFKRMPPKEPTIEDEIIANKELRRDTDAIIQRVKYLPPSRERSLTITKLQEGVMWLGMDLKRINDANPGSQPNPYPNSKDPATGTKIDPTADGLKL